MFGENHCHIILDGSNYKAAVARHSAGVDENWIKYVFEKYKSAGISFLRDGGDKAGVSAKAKTIASEFGIDYRTPVFAIYKKGNYGSILGKPFESETDFIALVKDAESQGTDFIKIMATGILDFACYGKISEGALSLSELKMITHICHSEGLSVMSHTNGAENVLNALESGVDSLEHGFYLNDEAITALSETGAVWVPTLTACKNLLNENAAAIHGFDREVVKKISDLHESNIKKALNAGCFVALGSDAGAYGVKHVCGVKNEYEYFCRFYDKPDLDRKLLSAQEKISEKFKRKNNWEEI